MKKYIFIILCCFCILPIQAAIEVIFHSKVIQSLLPPPPSENPTNFQQYLGAFNYLPYEYNRKNYYVLIGYPNNKLADATTVVDNLNALIEQIVAQE
jgi:hypothetical protein